MLLLRNPYLSFYLYVLGDNLRLPDGKSMF